MSSQDWRLLDPIWQKAASSMIGAVASGRHSFDSERLRWMENVLDYVYDNPDYETILQTDNDLADLVANTPIEFWRRENANTPGFDFQPPEYSPFSDDYNGHRPTQEGRWATQIQGELDRRESEATYSKDYWTARQADFTVPGKDGFDMSPSDSALHTWYAQERIDQGLDDEEYGTHALRDIQENLEDRFLDEVYDNEGNVREGVEAHWGLDLRRVGLGHTRLAGSDWSSGGDLDVLSDSYYEDLTKGQVNWAAYQNDNAYIAAFKELQDKYGEGFDITTLGQEEDRTAEYVNMIRTVNRETDVLSETIKNDDGGWKVEWEGKYDPDKIVANAAGDLYIDGERQTPVSELYAEGKGRLLDPKDYTLDHVWATKKEQIAQVVKPDIQASQVTVTKPNNIPDSWDVGEGTTSLKIGGKE